MPTNHIQTLECRRLLSAAHSVTLAPAETPAGLLPGVIAAVSSDFTDSEVTLTRRVSGRQVLTEAGQFLLSMVSQPQLVAAKKAKPAPVATPSYTLTFVTPDFTVPDEVAAVDASTLAPFPASYTFKLNAKKPLSLFNITQKVGGQVLNFTGTLSKNLQTITGALTLHRKGNSLAFKYTATPEATGT